MFDVSHVFLGPIFMTFFVYVTIITQSLSGIIELHTAVNGSRENPQDTYLHTHIQICTSVRYIRILPATSLVACLHLPFQAH